MDIGHKASSLGLAFMVWRVCSGVENTKERFKGSDLLIRGLGFRL